ncbi:hypothetical protein COE56_28540 [Bacillus anthracis]|nr:hypothetical protein COE56_28540 [Bacillus anthracis]
MDNKKIHRCLEISGILCRESKGITILSFSFGRNLDGLLIYNNEGYMSVSITGENQPCKVILDFENTSTEEQALAVNHISYSELFKIEGEIVFIM